MTVVPAAAFEEPWRVACPAGHVSLTPAKDRQSAYCKLCGTAYPTSALVDRKEVSSDRRTDGR